MAFYCAPCEHNCKDVRAFRNHVASNKHIKNVSPPSLVIEEYKCNVCQSIYKHKKSLVRHQKTCSAEQMENVPQHVQEAIIARWRAANSANEMQSQQTPQLPVITQTIPTIISGVVNINPFGKEEYSHISFDECINKIYNPVDAYKHFVEELYRDPKNHNMLYTDKKKNMVTYINENNETEIVCFVTVLNKAYDLNKTRLQALIERYIGNVIQRVQAPNLMLRYYHVDLYSIIKLKLLEVAHSNHSIRNFAALNIHL